MQAISIHVKSKGYLQASGGHVHQEFSTISREAKLQQHQPASFSSISRRSATISSHVKSTGASNISRPTSSSRLGKHRKRQYQHQLQYHVVQDHAGNAPINFVATYTKVH
jgi:hypothetical protein